MSDIVERLKFDAVRCELQFSKGVAGNISEAAAEIERLQDRQRQMLNWLRHNANAETEVNMHAAFVEAHNVCLAIAEGRA